jgi:PAN domain-containing protein
MTMKGHKMQIVGGMLVVAGMLAGVPAQLAAQQPYLFGNQYLFYGQSILDANCRFRLTMQSDGNLVLYDESQGTRPIWASNTVGWRGFAVMQTDGNFVMYRWGWVPFWSTGTWGYPGAFVAMQADGNLVVYDRGARPLWATGTNVGGGIGTSNCGASSTVVEPDWNRFGGDYAGFPMKTPDFTHCAYWCAQDANCKAFTYVPPGRQFNDAMCWLKDSVPSPHFDPGLVSGRIMKRE